MDKEGRWMRGPSSLAPASMRRWGHPSSSTTTGSNLSEEERNQTIFRKVRGILNKLTPEKFDKLSDALLSLGLNSTPILKGVILLIFEKALEEPKYSSMYAQLCKKLSRDLPKTTSDSRGGPSSSSGSSSPSLENTFCKLLLIKCQDEFENRLKASEKFKEILAERQKASNISSKNSDSNGNNRHHESNNTGKKTIPSLPSTSIIKLSEEEEEQRNIAKSKMLGNIKFIGELGRQGLVQESILHMCIQQLLSRKTEESVASKSDDLECLCQIIKTVGRLLDTEKAQKRMDQYFNKIQEYSVKNELPSRIRFMLQDVIELRNNKWTPRRVQKELGPRTIGQVREEAARDLGIPNPLYWNLNSAALQGVFGPTGLMMPGSTPLSSSLGSRSGPPLPLYGHPALPLFDPQGQRSLDDMGYYANSSSNLPFLSAPPSVSASGVDFQQQIKGKNRGNQEMKRTGEVNQVPHVRGHMPYRGSSSQDDPRNDMRRNQQPDRVNQQPIQQQQQQFPQRRDYDGDRGRGADQRTGQTRNNMTSLGGPGMSSQQMASAQNLPPRLQRNLAMSGSIVTQQQPAHLQHHQFARQSVDRHGSHSGLQPGRGGPGPMSGMKAPQMSHSVHASSSLPGNRFPPQSSLSGDISLRPAENSMVVLKPHLKPASSQHQEAVDNKVVAQNKKPAQEEPQVNQKEVLLKKTEDVIEQMILVSNQSTDSVNEEDAASGEATSAEKIAGSESLTSPCSVDEITVKMKELKIPKNLQSEVIAIIIKTTLSKTDKDRENASSLLINLKKEVLVSNTVFITAVKKLLSSLKSLEVDDPLVKTHLSEFIARAVSPGIVSLSESLDLVHTYYPMFLLILQQLAVIEGREWLSSQVDAHKISLMSILPEADRNKEQLADILDNRGLSFLMPLLRIESDLNKLLLEEDSSPSTLFKWIKDTVDPTLVTTKDFILILFTCLTKFIVNQAKNDLESSGETSGDSRDKKQAELEKEGIKSFVKVLKSFVFDKPSLQLTALYALQTVCHELKFPKGMLLRWFNALYDLEVIEDEVFLRWKEDINDDFPGKGQALFQVNTWLIWLAEAEAEESEEEVSDEEVDG